MKKVNKKRFEADKMAKTVCGNEPELRFLEKKLVNYMFLVLHIGSKLTSFKWNYLGCFPSNSLVVTVIT